MKQKIDVDALIHQFEFIESDARHTALVGGYGSGKSFAGVLKTLLKKIEYGTNIPVAYYLPTYGLITDVAYPKFLEMLEIFGIKYTTNKSQSVINTDVGQIYLRSMQNPERIIGYEVGYSLIDETDILPKEKMTTVFAMIIGRNRSKLPDNKKNKVDVVGTPEGFKWLNDFFVTKDNANKKMIKARTLDNPYLPDGYIESLEDTYDKAKLKAYLNGDFVNFSSGTVYHSFSEKYHTTELTINPKETLYIGMDFNIEKMASVIFVIRKSVIYALDEFTNVYDTFQMIDLIKEKYDKHPKIIFPDASGNNRKSSGESDHQALKRARFIVYSMKKNPNIKDRVNYKNLAFQKEKLFVNAENCPSYIEALKQQSYDKNGVPDKTTGHDHVNDAGGYGIYGLVKHKKLIKL